MSAPMTNKPYTAMLALTGLLFSLTAPFVVPLALFFTRRTAMNLPAAFAWYDTPDEDDLFDLGEPQVQWIYEHFGWFMTAWHWFGFRNRGHGFMSLKLSRSAQADGKYGHPDTFFMQRQWLVFRLVFGWQIYRSIRYATGYEYRPRLAIKIRRPDSLEGDQP